MATIVTVPGIWSKGQGSTDLLTKPLQVLGHEVHEIDQKIRSPWNVRNKKKVEKDALQIADTACAVNARVGIGHSYGCLKLAVASEYWHFDHLWLFRPAMSRNFKFNCLKLAEESGMETQITCVYSKQDWAILLGSLLVAHRFGAAGRKGFKDKRVRNLKSYGRHSEDFSGEMKWLWAHRIHNDLTV